MYCIYSDHQRDRVVVCSTLVAFALSDSWTAFHVVHGLNTQELFTFMNVNGCNRLHVDHEFIIITRRCSFIFDDICRSSRSL